MHVPQEFPLRGRLGVETVAGVDGSTSYVVSLIGELDTGHERQLRDTLCAHLNRSPAVMVIDLSELTFIDSTILGVLVAAHRRAQALGSALRLVAPPPFVQRLLKLTALDTLLDILPDLPTALFGVERPRRP